MVDSKCFYFCFFPWVMLSIFAIRNNLLYGFSLYYFLVSWQLGNLYPAFSYALGLAGLVWLWKVTERKDLSLKGSVVAALAGVWQLLPSGCTFQTIYR